MPDQRTRYRCQFCDYVYDLDAGDPASGIPPGVEFDALPDTRVCPAYGVGKDQFERVEE